MPAASRLPDGSRNADAAGSHSVSSLAAIFDAVAENVVADIGRD
jgi:hypothetical protein